MKSTKTWLGLGVCAVAATAPTGCKSGAAPEPESRREEPTSQGETAAKRSNQNSAERTATKATADQRLEAQRALAARKIGGKPVAGVPATPGDPAGGKFTVDAATKGLPPGKTLTAEIKTSEGALQCELWPDKAPLTVANFVGLARGLRPWKDRSGEWVKKPLYDGTPFHRVIPGFMIQGGDPEGTGAGGPGYVIPDEIWEDAHHDERGLICMANRGPNTNGSQFFIMDGSAPHLDGGYTIFGKCGPETVIQAIAGVKRQGDRAVAPAKITKVSVQRK